MFDISRMDLMWVSFYSMGAMALAALLIYIARYKMPYRLVSIILSIAAWLLLIFSFITMILVLGGSSHA
ncbi:DUF2768 family protein [Nosocomiicoccus ampullae]|uniref:Membrane protein YqjE n=1 Tax=Nosocomiicoccus ampullae TaxID=489910 RepID=A0A9Q2CZH5_9STAP|nr:DUF2768 family protein [Nosocomiicoccus ampullae]MBB5176374.1 putative membrane protein YqjE [Nosocomiicoccus ampullae]QYA46208.1 DUF2768 domain-containing protein [Nosocomiicoccus ampullae]